MSNQMMPAVPAAPPVPVGEALRVARAEAGLTREQLAVLAGIGSATIERIEHGTVTPRRATLQVIAIALADLWNAKSPAGEPGSSTKIGVGPPNGTG